MPTHITSSLNFISPCIRTHVRVFNWSSVSCLTLKDPRTETSCHYYHATDKLNNHQIVAMSLYQTIIIVVSFVTVITVTYDRILWPRHLLSTWCIMSNNFSLETRGTLGNLVWSLTVESSFTWSFKPDYSLLNICRPVLPLSSDYLIFLKLF